MYCTQWVNKNNIDQIRVCFLRIPFGFMYNHKCHHRYHLSKSGNGNYLDVMALSAWFLRSLRQKDSYYLRVSVSSLHRHSTSAQSAYWVGISWRLESNKHSTMMKHRKVSKIIGLGSKYHIWKVFFMWKYWLSNSMTSQSQLHGTLNRQKCARFRCWKINVGVFLLNFYLSRFLSFPYIHSLSLLVPVILKL